MKTLILALALIAFAVRPSATPSCFPCDGNPSAVLVIAAV
jgi:hypothetical protein